ncbi:CENP-S associating centromere protein X-domain-containing protein [Aspergillus bertholletiae]|uniref:CENP-S associating centromere protein X-domain-containing protein n=1 Tax=Aspergillus bertholletiae TaxID=1226010 RepID=A0A5N7AVF7_9EURO|nr:CENP-S associating centromere protein X-domain-containing protein [Aspergillus bertholletiae]
MPPERQPVQKRRQLPFKPPSRQPSTTAAGPSTPVSGSASTTSKPNPKTKAKAKAKAPTKQPTPAKASSSKAAPRPSRYEATESSPAASEEEGSGSSRSARSPSDSSEEPDYILAEIMHADTEENDILSSEPAIPPKLLTKLVHHHFKGQKSKIAKDANEVVAKYVDVFVREALARAAFERAEGGQGAERGVGDGFLEVEDLEKMAPQLVLDF